MSFVADSVSFGVLVLIWKFYDGMNYLGNVTWVFLIGRSSKFGKVFTVKKNLNFYVKFMCLPYLLENFVISFYKTLAHFFWSFYMIYEFENKF